MEDTKFYFPKSALMRILERITVHSNNQKLGERRTKESNAVFRLFMFGSCESYSCIIYSNYRIKKVNI